MRTIITLAAGLFVMLAAALSGCASSNSARKENGEPEYKRGKLSEAMQKASNENKGERKVADSDRKPASEKTGWGLGDLFGALSSGDKDENSKCKPRRYEPESN